MTLIQRRSFIIERARALSSPVVQAPPVTTQALTPVLQAVTVNKKLADKAGTSSVAAVMKTQSTHARCTRPYRSTPKREKTRNSTYRNRIVVADRIRQHFGDAVPVEGEGFARAVAAIRWCRANHPLVLKRLYKGATAAAARRNWKPTFLPASN